MLREAPGPVDRGGCANESARMDVRTAPELPADVPALCLSHPFTGSQSVRLVKTPVGALCCERHLDQSTEEACANESARMDVRTAPELPADVPALCLSHPFTGSQSVRLVKTPVGALCCERHLDQSTEEACANESARMDVRTAPELPADVPALCLSHPFTGSQSVRLVKTPVGALCCERHLDQSTEEVAQTNQRAWTCGRRRNFQLMFRHFA